MKLASLLAPALLLTGCSTLSGVEGRVDKSECSLNSNPICIPIGGKRGQAMKEDIFDVRVGNNFKVSDFVCKCGCGEMLYTPRLIETLDKLKNNFQRDVVVTSGFRCDKRNKEVGGVEGSLHTTGQAVDFVVRGVSPAKVAQYLHDFDGGVGLYERHVHIDVGVKKRWDGKYAGS